jgi:Fe2+ transport system protein FeoA
MDMWGALPVEGQSFQVAARDMRQLCRTPLQLGMASCHSLTLINGALSGDPLDVKVRCCKRLKAFKRRTIETAVAGGGRGLFKCPLLLC